MTNNAIRRLSRRAEAARLLAQIDADDAAIRAAGYTLEDPSAHWFGTPVDVAHEEAEFAGRTSRRAAHAMRRLRGMASLVRVAAEHVAAAGPMSARGGSHCFLFVAGEPATVTEHRFTGHGQRGSLRWL